LNFSRQASVVRVAIGGVQLSGTLYDTNDLSIRGTDGVTEMSLRGIVVPERGTAPQRVTGTLTLRAGTCEAQEHKLLLLFGVFRGSSGFGCLLSAEALLPLEANSVSNANML
jgi:hypothetical protein